MRQARDVEQANENRNRQLKVDEQAIKDKKSKLKAEEKRLQTWEENVNLKIATAKASKLIK
jgi:hypothetical protein